MYGPGTRASILARGVCKTDALPGGHNGNRMNQCGDQNEKVTYWGTCELSLFFWGGSKTEEATSTLLGYLWREKGSLHKGFLTRT